MILSPTKFWSDQAASAARAGLSANFLVAASSSSSAPPSSATRSSPTSAPTPSTSSATPSGRSSSASTTSSTCSTRPTRTCAAGSPPTSPRGRSPPTSPSSRGSSSPTSTAGSPRRPPPPASRSPPRPLPRDEPRDLPDRLLRPLPLPLRPPPLQRRLQPLQCGPHGAPLRLPGLRLPEGEARRVAAHRHIVGLRRGEQAADAGRARAPVPGRLLDAGPGVRRLRRRRDRGPPLRLPLRRAGRVHLVPALGRRPAGLPPARPRECAGGGRPRLVAGLRRADHPGRAAADEVHGGGGQGGHPVPAAGDDGPAHRRGGLRADGLVHRPQGHHRLPVDVRVLLPGVHRPGPVRPGPVRRGQAGGPGLQEELPGVRRRAPPVRRPALRHKPPDAVHHPLRDAARLPAAQDRRLRRHRLRADHRAQGRLQGLPPQKVCSFSFFLDKNVKKKNWFDDWIICWIIISPSRM
ncbi:putative transcription factor [Iris pallida]|uniref:Transcription factor n=1 Tax=Iris pallida TaxID=29817 RepID=A0AAX6G441_IRIPA|nr:putative transcription factor [Iris pallida]